MRVAALYDIHGNLPALEAVLADAEREDADLVVVGGDMVSGPLPRQTLERLLGLGRRARFLRGNADRELVELRRRERGLREGGMSDRWVAEQLTDEQAAFLAGLPLTVSVEVDGLGGVLFCHASPRGDEELFWEQTPDDQLAPLVADVDEATVLCGHTHMQFDRRVAGKRVVNAGSVGMPYGQAGACWALLGPDVNLRHTSYDLQQAAAAARAGGWPQADLFVAENVLSVPSREEAFAFFEQVRARLGA